MTEQETLIWNISKSDNLAFLEFFPAFRDRSAMIGAASSLDGNGVGFDVLTPAAFLAHYGTPPQPRLPMGPAVGAGGPPVARVIRARRPADCAWAERASAPPQLGARD